MFVTQPMHPLYLTAQNTRSESQEERIYMLNMALIEKGVVMSSSHYELTQPPAAAAIDEQQEVGAGTVVDDLGGADDGGILL